jgi:hypothetical protein
MVVNPQMVDRRTGQIRQQRSHLFGNDTRKLTVGRLRRNQLPDPVVGPHGDPIHPPPSWKPEPLTRRDPPRGRVLQAWPPRRHRWLI